MSKTSKVIKATHLVITLPRLIEFQQKYREEVRKSDLEHEVPDDEPFDSETAQAIVAETEEMVQQLLCEARIQAKKIISDARAEAQALLQEAREEIDAFKKEAEKAGFEAGFAAGKQALEEEWKKFNAFKASEETALEERRRRLIQQTEQELVELAVNIARQIIHAELRLAPEQIAAIAKATLAKALECGEVTLRVHSGDYEHVGDVLEKNGQNGKIVKVEVDNSLQNGGCLAETPYGIVDGTVEGQLQAVAYDLLEVSQGG
ncbi:MAG: FliH/SctL family protein [Bacillota bacterium]|nr:FliH/SctL family protein [Bacillota bacterium]